MNSLLADIVNFSCCAFVIVGDEQPSQFSKLCKWSKDLIQIEYPVPAIIETYLQDQKHVEAVCDAMEVSDYAQANETSASKKTNENIAQHHLLKEKGSSHQRAFVPRNAINLKPLTLEIQSLDQIKSDFISLDTYSVGTSNKSTVELNKSIKRGKPSIKIEKKLDQPTYSYQSVVIHKTQGNVNKKESNGLSKKALKRLKKMEKKKNK